MLLLVDQSSDISTMFTAPILTTSPLGVYIVYRLGYIRLYSVCLVVSLAAAVRTTDRYRGGDERRGPLSTEHPVTGPCSHCQPRGPTYWIHSGYPPRPSGLDNLRISCYLIALHEWIDCCILQCINALTVHLRTYNM